MLRSMGVQTPPRLAVVGAIADRPPPTLSGVASSLGASRFHNEAWDHREAAHAMSRRWQPTTYSDGRIASSHSGSINKESMRLKSSDAHIHPVTLFYAPAGI